MAPTYSDSPETWPTKDIVYLSIIGPVMLMAVFEWMLWLAAFIYCLVKVYAKADQWSIRVLAVVMVVLFSLVRYTSFPSSIACDASLAASNHNLLASPDGGWISDLRILDLLTFSILLIGPWLCCVYVLTTNALGRNKRIKQVLDDHTAPKTVVVMPVYKEAPAILIKAVDSVVDCDYPASCIHVFLSYDGGQVDEQYLEVIGHLGIPNCLRSYPQSIDCTYKGARITVSRFKHGVYAHYLRKHDDLFLLFIDSDCILDRVCLQNFMYDMELKPGSKRNMLAMTGIITSTTEKNSLITILQDMEYVHGQLFERSVESGCGAMTCLPGALTILRFSSFRKMAKYYFSDKAEQCDDIFDYGKCHLGEDRWLTHLFMIGAKKRYQIQLCTSAFCKTEAVQSFGSLLKQRRRWFLGFITNEVCMITDARLWVKYPLLRLVRFMQNTIRTTALIFFIMVIALITTSKRMDELPVGFMGVSLGLNYLLMLYFGIRLRRFKAWLYPLMFLVNPFLNWVYMVYGIFTAGQRTWGGPRADAATADDQTTPGEAAQRAKEQGDEFNVNVDTFRTKLVRRRSVPVRPSEAVEGRFARTDHLVDGIYVNTSGSGPALARMVNALEDSQYPKPPFQLRDSIDSMTSESSDCDSSSIALPHSVEHIAIGVEDQRRLEYARQARASMSTTSFDEHGLASPFSDSYTLRTMSSGSEHDELLRMSPPVGIYQASRSANANTLPRYTEPPGMPNYVYEQSYFPTP
ncbi:unnamed protein product [Penicillium salamii]|uniref:chitin synthase n=1 Tax=Penicillium salamii TaxID=1612424 RepID=A0A9W4JYT9_9EURO|nr:unnamed protein product [Penicillium salamii]